MSCNEPCQSQGLIETTLTQLTDEIIMLQGIITDKLFKHLNSVLSPEVLRETQSQEEQNRPESPLLCSLSNLVVSVQVLRSRLNELIALSQL